MIDGPTLRYILTRKCVDAGGQSAWAKAHGVTAACVSDIINGRRDPSEHIANALGYFRKIVFVPVRSDSDAVG